MKNLQNFRTAAWGVFIEEGSDFSLNELIEMWGSLIVGSAFQW